MAQPPPPPPPVGGGPGGAAPMPQRGPNRPAARPPGARAPPGSFFTDGVHGQSVAWSPYHGNLLAVAASQNFGIAGAGQLSVLQQDPSGAIVEKTRLEWPDGLFGACWSEEHENQLVTASGDGTVHLWDLGLANHTRGPLRVFKGHTKEVVCVDWNQTRGPPLFLSASWDCGVNLWDPSKTAPVATFREHLGQVYGAMWSPRKAGIFASCSSDGTLKVWDARRPPNSVQTFKAHDHEVLTCDWSKYNENLVVTGSVDKTIRGFDLRAGPGGQPLFILAGHSYAVRRVKCSPHHPTMIASSSYDFTTRIWDPALQGPARQVRVFDDHSEFVIGLDFNVHVPGVLADCSWDETVVVRKV
eukprot:m.460831 g.460831  ORF g.460831 m.460831 type:complete len:357 (+) comp22150_c0_seq1:259-1329(+)